MAQHRQTLQHRLRLLHRPPRERDDRGNSQFECLPPVLGSEPGKSRNKISAFKTRSHIFQIKRFMIPNGSRGTL